MKTIKFSTTDKYIDTPIPAKKFVPDWYKKLEKFLGSGNSPKFVNGHVNKTAKHCMPLLDGFTAGYMVVTWVDILVEQREGKPVLQWAGGPDIVKMRPSAGNDFMPVPAGHDSANFVWCNQTHIKTPVGYSIMVTHPSNRFDLPFTTLSGVIDTDTPLHDGNLPFFLKEGFEGTIPKGTPIFQVVPFKRENWESKIDRSISNEANKNAFDAGSVLFGWYKSTVWKRKTYN